MEQDISLYYSLQKALGTARDDSLLVEADRQMTIVENRHPDLLKKMAGYVLEIKETHAENDMFAAAVLGADGHALAHLLETLYPKASIYWFVDTESDIKEYAFHMDWLFVSASVADMDFFLKNVLRYWSIVLKVHGKCCLLQSAPKADYVVRSYINQAGFCLKSMYTNGLLVLEYIDDLRGRKVENSRFKKIYVACPGAIKTGGPELLHQLVHRLNSRYGNAEIFYTNAEEEYRWCHPEFLHYVAGHISRWQEIEDNPENVLIVPEGWSAICNMGWKMSIYLWWLSVDNFKVPYENKYRETGNENDRPEKIIERLNKVVTLHMVQSEYARDYIICNGIPKEKICHLADYISQNYLDQEEVAKQWKKEDIVLYNPKKGKDFVERLMQAAPDINWVPIQNMTTEQVADIMQRSKVYIDFGNHPGKDRIPREAAISGCVVITGKKGSAAFGEDVPIPEKYKLDESKITYEEVVLLIRDCLMNYETCNREYETYRKRIREEKEVFFREVDEIFGKLYYEWQ